MTDDFELVDAPPPTTYGPGRPKSAWRLFGEAHPNQWFIKDRAGNGSTPTSQIGWSYAVRTNGDGTWTVYAKYVPTPYPEPEVES